MVKYNVYKITFETNTLANDDVLIKKLHLFRIHVLSELNITSSYIDSLNVTVSFIIKNLDELCAIMKIAQIHNCYMIDCECK